MNKKQKLSWRDFVGPFTFDGWNGEEVCNPVLDFDKEWLWTHNDFAKRQEESRHVNAAEVEREWALWWCQLKDMPRPAAERVASDIWHELRENTDALLTLAQTAKGGHASLYLSLVIEQATGGLASLAAHGDNQAARMLVNSLLRATDRFNMLAYHKPDVFRDHVAGSVGIPGIINGNKARAANNAALVRKLGVGSKGIIPQARAGRAPRVATPRNAWAIRLWNYLILQLYWFSLCDKVRSHEGRSIREKRAATARGAG